ncbi:hypothetical protein BC827DRAFT_1234503 [Russula dissimulans]|nr:hypothetical protein BC827DRAFT_1234503 [Russula dissimulans]
MTLGLNLDYIIRFTVVPEKGREIDGFNESELAHRVNLLRLLGAVKTEPDTSRPSTIT